MSATLTSPPPRVRGDRVTDPAGATRPTLEQTLERAWSAARVDGADCPLCHGRMAVRGGAAVCSDCGSRLS